MSYFPLLIRFVATDQTKVVKTAAEIPIGIAFIVLRTNYK